MSTQKDSHKTRIACCQIALVPDESLNLNKCLNLIDQAGQIQADLIVLPEMSNWSAGLVKSKTDALAHGVTLQGEFIQAIADKAHQYGSFIAVGVIEREGQDSFITSVIISPERQIVLKYQKQIPFGPQIAWAQPGRTGNPVVDLPFARVGLYICADGLIPETTRVLALKGAQLLINTLHSGGSDETYLHVPVRAYENRVWLASANKVGKRDGAALDRFSGGSQIVSPLGEIVARADELSDSFIWADIDFNDPLQKMCQKQDVWDLRRPECYEVLTKKPMYPFDEKLFKGPASLGVASLQPYGHGPLALQAAIDEWRMAVYEDGARLVVMPYLIMHDLKGLQLDLSECVMNDQNALDLVKAAAQKTASWVVFSSLKANLDAPKKFHVCTDLIDPSGAIFGSHIQVHLPKHFQGNMSMGSDFLVLQTPIGAIGLLSGADAQVLESYRVLSYQGVQVICISGEVDNPKEIDLALRERVAENRIHVVLASRGDSPCSNGSAIVQASAYPSEPHWRVRFPDVKKIELNQKRVSACLDLLATRDKTVAAMGCDLFLSPRHEEYKDLLQH